jgi:hypothetical protein
MAEFIEMCEHMKWSVVHKGLKRKTKSENDKGTKLSPKTSEKALSWTKNKFPNQRSEIMKMSLTVSTMVSMALILASAS